jgi:hypothetical protein
VVKPLKFGGFIAMSFSIDMSDPATRKWTIVVTAKARLKIEITCGPRFFPSNYPPVLPALHRLGFTSKTRKKMLIEIQEWLDKAEPVSGIKED